MIDIKIVRIRSENELARQRRISLIYAIIKEYIRTLYIAIPPGHNLKTAADVFCHPSRRAMPAAAAVPRILLQWENTAW